MSRGLDLLLAGLVLAAPAGAAEPPRVLEEEVEVRLVLADLRVLDRAGHPVHGLKAADFRVEVDGRPAEIDALRWVDGAYSVEEVIDTEAAPATPPGQLVVLFFQRDMNPSRMVGLMRMRPEVMRFVEGLGPHDRVAVLVHDRHLKLYSDFSDDRRRLLEILDDHIVHAKRPQPVAGDTFPSLARHLDREAAARAATADEALGVIAAALKPLPGTKSLVFVGWGLGTFVGGSVMLTGDTTSAVRGLIEARTSIFGLDVTMADWHTLEIPFTRVAVDTGGFYAKTHVFSNAPMDRVARALSGHYELWFVRPDLPEGGHRLKVELRDRGGIVFHNNYYFDEDR